MKIFSFWHLREWQIIWYNIGVDRGKGLRETNNERTHNMNNRMTFEELESILGRELTVSEICDIGIAAIDGKSDEQIVAEMKAKDAQRSRAA